MEQIKIFLECFESQRQFHRTFYSQDVREESLTNANTQWNNVDLVRCMDCGLWMELPLEVEFRFCCNSIGCIRGRCWSKWQGRWKCGKKRICELFIFSLQGPEQREIRDGKKQNNKEVDGDPLVLLEQHWMQQRDASAAVQLFNFHENQQEVQVALGGGTFCL